MGIERKHDKLCFVIMPFDEGLRKVYSDAIKLACVQAQVDVLRADELIGPYNIHRDIIQYIFNSDVVIADLTDWNPNVFYEMGVVHAIDNKTILIIKKGQKLPFDIGNYRCIQYEDSKKGLEKLSRKLIEYLHAFDEWRNHPTNPVQDFKPKNLRADSNEIQGLKQMLQDVQLSLKMKEKQLQNTVPKSELEKTQETLLNLEKSFKENRDEAKNKLTKVQLELRNAQEIIAAKGDELDELQKKLSQYKKEKIKQEKPEKKNTLISLRSQANDKLSGSDVKQMLKKYDFYCRTESWSKEWSNPDGKGIQHQYEKQHDGKVVFDGATGLCWQQSGSSNTMVYKETEKYIEQLNREKFAGFSDWRLPTLEEGMSLMESTKTHGDLYIDPLFDKTQRYFWTVDKSPAGFVWVVDFYYGHCGLNDVDDDSYVRAVRS